MKSISSPKNNSVLKYFAFVFSFFFELNFLLVEGIRNLSNFHSVAMKEAGTRPLIKGDQGPSCHSWSPRGSVFVGLYEMTSEYAVDTLNDAHVPLLLGVL